MNRRDDPDRTDFLYVPSAVIYHDKERLLNGKLGIRKIELCRPRIRVVRGRDGKWNLADVLGPVDLTESIPTIVIQQGTILVEDHQAAQGTPPVEIKDVCLTLVNDPRPIVTLDGTGNSLAGGTFRLTGRWQRKSGDMSLVLEATKISVGPELVRQFAGYCPDLASHAGQLEGKINNLRAQLGYHPGTAQPWSHNVHLEFVDGKLSHPRIPLALEKIEGLVHVVNGRIDEVKATAFSGPDCRMKLEVHDFVPSAL